MQIPLNGLQGFSGEKFLLVSRGLASSTVPTHLICSNILNHIISYKDASSVYKIIKPLFSVAIYLFLELKLHSYLYSLINGLKKHSKTPFKQTCVQIYLADSDYRGKTVLSSFMVSFRTQSVI